MSKQHDAPAFRSNPMANLSIVHGWFDEAALDIPYPADDDCYNLARELQIAVNRSNNQALEKRAGHEVPLSELLDVSPVEIISKRWWAMRSAGNSLAFHIERFLEYSPDLSQRESEGIAALQEGLSLISACPIALSNSAFSAPPSAGRPISDWHAVAHAISPKIQALLRGVGYSGRVKKTDQEGATAIIGAAAVSWAYNIKLDSGGFASAMRRRDRRQKSKLARVWTLKADVSLGHLASVTRHHGFERRHDASAIPHRTSPPKRS